MKSKISPENAKKIIKEGINENIDFSELRKLLPDMCKRPIVSLVFDVMEELGIKQIPFPGMVSRPRQARKRIPVGEDGSLNILELLKEKGFEGKACEARCHIGEEKITLTIKPIKQDDKDDVEKNKIDFVEPIEQEFERMSFVGYN